MRYWAILLSKLLAAMLALSAIWWALHAVYTPPFHVVRFGYHPFLHDLTYTAMVFAFLLLAQAAIFLIVWDQRRRCRTCGRLLRMPISSGRYAQRLLFGQPKTQYICLYGHGTLTVPDVNLSGREPNDWQAHEDIWKELYALDSEDKK